MKRNRLDVFHKRNLDTDRVNSIGKYRKERKIRKNKSMSCIDINNPADSPVENPEIEKTDFSERRSFDNLQDIYNYLNTAL